MQQRSPVTMFVEDGRFAHGGNVRRLAEKAGCRPEDLLDFSANFNPLGPPPWLRAEMSRFLSEIDRYPDPESAELTLAAAERYRVWPTEVMAGNGASELLLAAAAVAAREGVKQAVVPVPAYVDYERACELAGLPVATLALSAQDGFAVDFQALEARLDKPSLVFLCQPNNPTGRTFEAQALRELAQRRPDCRFIADESFADFVPDLDRLVRDRPANVRVVLSLTKFYSIPGLRLGLAFGPAETVAAMKRLLPVWSVNGLAQRVGTRCLKDAAYAEATLAATGKLREELTAALRDVPGLQVFPGAANFLLCRVNRVGMGAGPIFENLLKDRVAVRLCGNFQGLDETFFRVAVRGAEDNARLVGSLRRAAGLPGSGRTGRRTPALMVAGTSSGAGKSVLVAALCRILLQDGWRVAPFKAQNMSNNSFVTADGREIGRAQATQAQACRLAPDARMNPVLLKPGSDTGCQVLVMGRPVGNMGVDQYVAYKPRAFEAVKAAYDSLAAEYDVVVLEGAGSPAEINLKHHDIVNLAMAAHAGAQVLLAGDIDRGGVFAALIGTMECLTERERGLVAGFVLNKFRGEQKLLDPALREVLDRTGRPVLGVVPWLSDLGLPEEDSVAFKAGIGRAAPPPRRPDFVDVACLDLPRISNFTDLDALAAEPDVRLRVVASAADLGAPDAVIIPGSKSTLADLAALRESGLAEAVTALSGRTEIVGLCAGFQMLGDYILDPEAVESEDEESEALGLLPLRTTMDPQKTLLRTSAVHAESGLAVTGYEIHHGRTEALLPTVLASVTAGSRVIGFRDEDGLTWGAYLHGLFDDDAFRRWFIDRLRQRKGLPPLGAVQTAYDIEPALDRLADAVRKNLDMKAVYKMLGL